MLSCEEASRLLSEKQERKLSLKESAELGLHLTICSGCRQLDKQFSNLRSMIRSSKDHDEKSSK